MMKVKIWAVGPHAENSDDVKKLFKLNDKDGIEFVLDKDNPQFIVANETIYYHKSKYIEFLKYLNMDICKIFFAGECIFPDLNIFDYAVTYSDGLICEDRVCRMPTSLFFDYADKNDMTYELAEKYYDLRVDNFCNFIYSNRNGHEMRKILFYRLSRYKKVDSLGRYLNNVSEGKNFDSHWNQRETESNTPPIQTGGSRKASN